MEKRKEDEKRKSGNHEGMKDEGRKRRKSSSKKFKSRGGN